MENNKGSATVRGLFSVVGGGGGERGRNKYTNARARDGDNPSLKIPWNAKLVRRCRCAAASIDRPVLNRRPATWRHVPRLASVGGRWFSPEQLLLLYTRLVVQVHSPVSTKSPKHVCLRMCRADVPVQLSSTAALIKVVIIIITVFSVFSESDGTNRYKAIVPTSITMITIMKIKRFYPRPRACSFCGYPDGWQTATLEKKCISIVII